MDNKEYTAENILRVMGIKFPNVLYNQNKSLLMLFRPSFHPEVALLFDTKDNPSVNIYSSIEHHWNKPSLSRLPIISETHEISKETMNRVWFSFQQAKIALESGPKSVCITDGIYLDAWAINNSEYSEFHPNSYCHEKFDEFTKISIDSCWSFLSNPLLKMTVGRIIDRVSQGELNQFSEKTISPAKKNLYVLGNPEDCEEYFDLWNNYYKNKTAKEEP